MRAKQSISDVHGYDDELDQWFIFDTPEELDAWLQEVQQPERDVVTQERGDSNIGVFDFTVTTLPQVVLPFDPTRTRAILTFNDSIATPMLRGVGTATTPGAGATIASSTAVQVAGIYTITAWGGFEGVGDIGNNLRLATTQLGTIGVVPSSSGVNSPDAPITVKQQLAVGDIIAIKTNAAGAAGSVYDAAFNAYMSPGDNTSYCLVGRRESIMGGRGFRLNSGQQLNWETSHELWVVGVGVSANADLGVAALSLLP